MTGSRVSHPGERRWETNLLAVITLALTAFGIVNCYAAASYLEGWKLQASQQVTGAIAGGVLFVLAAYLDYTIWRKIARPLFYATVAGLAVLALAAIIWPRPTAPRVVEQFLPHFNGARRWVRLVVQVQVSEVARFTMVAFLAGMVADLGGKIRSFKDGFVPAMGVTVAVVLLVVVEPSVSMSLVLAAVGAAIVFAAGGKVPHFLPLVVAGAAGLWGLVTFESVRSARYIRFLQPALECNPRDDQACNSLIGVGNGGVFGVGFLEGTQKLGHLSYAYSDFLLSVIAEEWGLVGVTFVVMLFAIFCWLGFRIARSARDPFGMYLATGLTFAVGFTALCHAAVVLRMMPETGLTLPFMSAGRASLILYLFSAGVIVSVGRGRGRPARAP